MTKEEAIKWLKEHHSIDLNTKDDEAHRMAIKALEQEPCEDAISRQAVIDMTGLSNWFESSDDYNSFVEEVCALPPVTPIRPKGEWKCDHKNAYFQDRYVCSECGSERYFTRDTITNFCPNCGADMRGEQE